MGYEVEVVAVTLPNGAVMGVEVPRVRGAEDVGALPHLDLTEVQRAIEGLAEVIGEVFRRVRPQRATAELGLSLTVESGKLTGVLVQAGGSASLRISLGWERGPGEAEGKDRSSGMGELPDAGDG